MTYAERIAASRAKYAALIPPPIPLPPPVEWNLVSVKLSPIGKRDYYAVISNDCYRPTHLLHIHQCGERLQTTRHLYAFYAFPSEAKIIQDVLDTPPIIEGYTPPVIFHSLPDITLAIKTIIKTQIEN